MRKLLTSSTWNWITLGVALFGILSVGSLIGDVNQLQSQFDHHAEWIAGLKDLERSIWDLQMAALRPATAKTVWIQAESAYRGQIETLSKRAAGDRELAPLLTEVERQVNTIWGIHLAMATSETGQADAAAQLQVVGGDVRGQIHTAVQRTWDTQSEIARQVAAKWLSVKNQLILCCLLAGFPALLLRIHHLRVKDSRKTEGALEESEDRYKKLVDLLPDAVVVHRGGKIVFGNDALARLLHEPKADALIGRSILDLMHPDDHWVAWRNWEQFRETSKHTPLMEQRLMRHDGQTIDVDFVATSFRIEDQPAVLVVIRDISERKRSAETVRRTEARFRTLFDNVLEGVYRTTAEGQIVEANPSLVKMLGYATLDELRASDPFADTEKRQEWLEQVARDGEVANQEVTLRRKDGTPLVVLNHSRALRDEHGGTQQIEGTVTDITALKLTEQRLEEQARQLERTRDEALEASRLKSEFLANVSHEIRTPMTAVIGMTHLLLDSQLSLEQREYAETVKTQAGFLLELLNGILDFSKIEAGRLSFEHVGFSLRTTVASVMEMFADRAEAKGLDFAFLSDGVVPDSVTGDPIRLQQILTNMVGNAIKFTEQGRIVIACRALEHTGGAVMLRFTVEDSGIGIPQRHWKDLFEPFTQVDGSTTRRYGGTGLGLAISKQIAEAMGGDIGIESSTPEGSKFWFSVKLACVAKPAGLALAGPPVLVAVARAASRELHRRQAENWGWQTDEASTGAELMAKLAALRYSAVLIDAELPDSDLLAASELAGRLPQPPKLILLAPFGRRVMNEMGLETRPGFAAMLARPLRQAEWQNSLSRPTTAKPVEVALPLEQLQQALDPAVRILVTEDNVVNQKVALKLIRKLGYEADLAVNGREAVTKLAGQTYSLVFMDCQMPVLDGYSATAEIRRLENGSRHTPIVAMTAHAMQGDREKCLEAGMDDYLTKPIQLNELRRAIEQWALVGLEPTVRETVHETV